ncbi:MAG: enoyl-CoA hydratase-related protein [Rhizobiaceae bacterium]
MSQTEVTGQLDQTTGRLVLSNPQKYNALPQSAWLSIRPAMEKLVADGARVIIICGSDSHFCAGADISEFDTLRKNAATARVYEASNVEAFAAVRNCPVPTIAKLQGYCLGGGFGLAAACDLRVAEPNAKFAVPAAKLGLGYPVDAMADIVAAVGAQNAKRLLFTAARFSAEQMQEMGFVMDLVDAAALDDHVEALAASICQLAPLTHRATKASIGAMKSGDWEGAKLASDATFASQDYAEGRAAFREKRAAKFSGH